MAGEHALMPMCGCVRAEGAGAGNKEVRLGPVV